MAPSHFLELKMPDVPAPGFAQHAHYCVDILPCPKRVRTAIAGIVLADSRNVKLLRETRHTPVYYFPVEDVRVDEFLTATDHATHCPFKGDARYWTFQQGSRLEENIAWAYDDPFRECTAIKGHIAFYWDRMDVWFEDCEEVFVHPRDPLTRIDITRARIPLVVQLGDDILAQSDDYRILYETGLIPRFYVQREAVRQDLLIPSDHRTRCPYKGEAHYYHVKSGNTVLENLVWFYPNAIAEVGRIQDLLCFYQERVDAIEIGGTPLNKPNGHWADDFRQ